MTSPKGWQHKKVFEKLGETEVRLQLLDRNDDVGTEAREWVRLLEIERQERYLQALNRTQVNATRFGALVGGVGTLAGAIIGALLSWALQTSPTPVTVECKFNDKKINAPVDGSER